MAAAGALTVLTGCYRWVGIGDSVLYGQQPALRQAIDPDGKLDAVIGRGWSGSLDAATRLIPDLDPKGWVIVQEDGGLETPETYRAFVDAIVELTPDDRCIAWITPFNAGRPARNVSFNEQIREGLPVQPCHAVVPWHEVAAADVQGMTHDGLHPSAAGHAWIAAATAAAIESTPPPEPSPDEGGQAGS